VSKKSGKNNKFTLKNNVFFLGLVSLFADISSEMVYPFVPLFLETILHVGTIPIGFIEGLAESTASISTVFSGWISDRLKKRKFLAGFGYMFGIISRPLLALTQTWPQVAGLRFFDRVGKGIRTSPRDALIADSVSLDERGRSFGLHRAMDTIGAIIGPGVAFLVLLWLGQTSYRSLFILAAVPAIISVAIIIFFVRESNLKVVKKERIAFKWSSFDRRFKLFLVITAIFALGNSSNVFLILRAKDLGVSPILIPILYLLFNLTYASFSLPAGIISDAFGRRRILIIGYLAFGIVYLGFAFAPNSAFMLPLFILYGTYPALTDGIQRAFAADLVSEQLRATGLGVFHFTTGAVAFPSSVVGGLLWNFISPAATFIFGTASSFLAVLLFVFIFPMVEQ
jgi:MFS family permease